MKNLKYLRKREGKTQADVAAAMGVTRTTYNKWENGRNEPSLDIVARLAEYFGETVDFLTGKVTPPTKLIRVPVLGNVAAGIPISAVTDIIDYEEVDEHLAGAGELFGLRIRGQSMEPRIMDGDIVIVRQQQAANNGDTCVVLVNGEEATVKRIKKEAAGLWLLPNNPSYEPMFFTAAEVEQLPVRIIGKVVELRGKF